MIDNTDTIKEKTTITIQTNDKGDTLYRSVVTDRERWRNRQRLKVNTEKLNVTTDSTKETIQRVEKTQEKENNQPATTLKYILYIILAITILIIILKK